MAADHYTLLGLSREVGDQEIQSVIAGLRVRLGSYAPGIDFGDDELARVCPEKWEAVRVLANPETRSEYDAGLLAHVAPPLPEPEPGISAPQGSVFATFLSYAAVLGLLSAGVLFLLLLAGYML